MPDLIKALRSGRILLMDGAMGTELQRAGIAEGECYEACNLTHPEKVRAIHREYGNAGAEVLLTNTFQANSAALARHHQEEQLAAIFQAGLAHARAAAPAGGWVVADIGPFPGLDWIAVRPILHACREADGVLLETFSDPEDVAVFIRANVAAAGPNKPVLVSFTFDGISLRTIQDATPEKCARAAAKMGAAALGVNCGRDLNMAACAEILRGYRAATVLPLFARPNAGTPTPAGAYPCSAEMMAAHLPDLFEAGAVMVGGCCGTTPQHIRAFRSVLGKWNAR